MLKDAEEKNSYLHASSGDPSIILGGVSPKFRIVLYISAGTKLLLECFLLIRGAGYIVYADSNEKLLLNAVALTFVIEIDEMVANFLLVDHMRVLVYNIYTIYKIQSSRLLSHGFSTSETLVVFGVYCE